MSTKVDESIAMSSNLAVDGMSLWGGRLDMYGRQLVNMNRYCPNPTHLQHDRDTTLF